MLKTDLIGETVRVTMGLSDVGKTMDLMPDVKARLAKTDPGYHWLNECGLVRAVYARTDVAGIMRLTALVQIEPSGTMAEISCAHLTVTR